MNRLQRTALGGFILNWIAMWNTDTEWCVALFGIVGLAFYVWFLLQE